METKITYIVRQWKRDHSVNIMECQVAADNLKCNSLERSVHGERLQAIMLRLNHGEVFETRHARFGRANVLGIEPYRAA